MPTTRIDNSADIIDSRDVIERIAELEAMAGGYHYVPDDGIVEELDPDDAHELHVLATLADECDAEDWQYGVTLIRDSYFMEYARELAEDCGMVPRETPWPTYCIDWQWATRELRMDYSSVELDGVTYWYR